MTHQNTIPCQVPGHEATTVATTDAYKRRKCTDCGHQWEVPLDDVETTEPDMTWSDYDDDPFSGTGAGIVDHDDSVTEEPTLAPA